MMDWLNKIGSFLGGIPWLKVAVYTALVSALVYEVHLIRQSGSDAQTIKELQDTIKVQKTDDDTAIKALKNQYAQDTTILEKERNDAVQTAKNTQQLLDQIKSDPSGAWAPAPVVVDTLKWLHEHHASPGDPSTKNIPTSRPSSTSKPAAGA